MEIAKTQKTITSLEIAEISGKAHNDVLKSIRSMESDWQKVCGGNFSLTSKLVKMPRGGSRKTEVYVLNRSECLYVSSKYNNEVRARLVLKLDKNSESEQEMLQDKEYIRKLYKEMTSLEESNKANNKRIKEIRAIVKEVSLKDYSSPNLFSIGG